MSIYSADINDPFILEMREWIKNNPFSEGEYEHHQDRNIPGPKHTEDIKLQISESNKEYYKTEEGILRRAAIASNNKKLKSEEMRRRWNENPEYMYSISASKGGRRKGSKNLNPTKPKCTIRKVTDGVTIYSDAVEAAKVYGIHPVNIRYKCRNLINDWSYVS